MKRRHPCTLPTLMLATVLAACSGEHETSRPQLVFLGVDGATWEVIKPMVEAGELPNFGQVLAEGSHGTMMTLGPQVSPVIWTTFVTGLFGRQHGILDFTYPYTPGPKVPVQSGQRLEPALWNLASDAGQSVAVVGYFASHPAEEVNGVMVTDRAIQNLSDSVYPADYLAEHQKDLNSGSSVSGRRKLFARFFDWPHRFNADQAHLASLNPAQREATSMVARRVDSNLIASEYLRRVTRFLMDRERFDLLITYFRNVDYASHSLWWYHNDDGYPDKPDPAVDALLEPVVAESYRYADDVLGEILDRMQPQDSLLIVSDHGFGSATGDYAINGPNPHRLNGNHRPDGIIAGFGPAFASGQEVAGVTILDVMPLLLKLMDLPLADDLPGTIPFDLLSPEVADRPVKTVPDYNRRNVSGGIVEVDDQAQQEALRQLRGLGYINEDFESGQRDEEFEFWQIPPNMLLEHVAGEVIFHILRDNPQVARSILRQAAASRPELARVFENYVRRIWSLLERRFPSDVLDPGKLTTFESGQAANP
ncbi:MAG: alkaline phosphatase family protein [Pseudomonadota bacterium]